MFAWQCINFVFRVPSGRLTTSNPVLAMQFAKNSSSKRLRDLLEKLFIKRNTKLGKACSRSIWTTQSCVISWNTGFAIEWNLENQISVWLWSLTYEEIISCAMASLYTGMKGRYAYQPPHRFSRFHCHYPILPRASRLRCSRFDGHYPILRIASRLRCSLWQWFPCC